MNIIDSMLNRITMYRLVLYYLLTLVGVAALFGWVGLLPYNPISILFSAGALAGASIVLDFIFAWGFGRPANVESALITGLIIALIVNPVIVPASLSALGGAPLLFLLALWAIASKYLLAWRKKHIFNPAAFAVALSAFVLNQSATWWVGGNLPMLLFVVVGGLLVVRKIRRFDLVFSFFVAALVTVFATTPGSFVTPLTQTLLHSAIFFLAFVMLTEPATTPPTRILRVVYGIVVGFLFAPNVHFGSFYTTPELALLIGNLYSYAVSPKGRVTLTLQRIERSAADIYDFVFSADRDFTFRPGQYLEWTLGHFLPDGRGNRRYFTIASSPTEGNVRLGVKFYDKPSAFKRALAKMRPGDTISAAQLSGSFTLPNDLNKKMVFIAGGIGITPFRSMVQYLLDRKETRPIIILYSNKKANDIAYKDMFDRARHELGIKTTYTITDEQRLLPDIYNGRIDAELIAQHVPDYRERTFYISGPHAMVNEFKATLHQMGVSPFKIKSDFFPGFA